jgi:hypothetical protein
MIKFPSVQTLFSQAWSALRRFPMTMLCAFVGTGILIYLTHNKWDIDEERIKTFAKIVMCCELGLCLFLAAKLFSESRGRGIMQELLLQFLVLGVLVGYYFSLSRFEDFSLVYITRYTLYIIAAHLAVAFAPFIGRGQINGFWQFNKTLFGRFLMCVLYSSVLYGGLALALWLMDELLHIQMSYKRYLYLWYVIGILFNTLFFLVGVPKDMKELDTDTSYPSGLKIFTQFVLLPLVSLYLLILYAYIAKILIQWNLPKGYVSYLVISFSGMGIFSLLLVYPIRHHDDNKWIKTFSRWFYVAIYPLIILLAIAIENRISDYGITVDRYFIVVLALWLVCIAAYFLWSKKENIKIIPVSLGIMAVLVSFGPWGAFSVAGHSQAHRLEKLMDANHMLVNGKVQKAKNEMSDSTVREMQSIVEYLSHSEGLEYVQPLFTQKFDSLNNSRYSYLAEDSIMTWMGIRSHHYYDGNGNEQFYFYAKDNEDYGVNVSGYDYYSHFSKYTSYRDSIEIADTTDATSLFVLNNTYSVVPSVTPNKYFIREGSKTLAVINLTDFLLKMKQENDTSKNEYDDEVRISNGKFVYEIQTDSISIKFIFKSIQTRKKNGKFYIENIDADVLSRTKR